MQQETAQNIALEALSWLAGQDNLIEAFLHNSGAEVDQLRNAAQDPGFLSGVLDFVLMQDEWVLQCASVLGCAPERLVHARAVLGGGDQMHWT
ncbi:DUF3572 family protein [Rhodobacteraceae bacterium]|nr:DUF3572 family protein [Paracoccaceae bacterium]